MKNTNLLGLCSLMEICSNSLLNKQFLVYSLVYGGDRCSQKNVLCRSKACVQGPERNIYSKTQASLLSYSAAKELGLNFTFWLMFFLLEQMGAFFSSTYKL